LTAGLILRALFQNTHHSYEFTFSKVFYMTKIFRLNEPINYPFFKSYGCNDFKQLLYDLS
jgi:hypothetical protein